MYNLLAQHGILLFLKLWALTFICMMAIDIIFIVGIMGKTYTQLLGNHLRIPSIHWPSAIIAWLLISAGIVIFVLPVIHAHGIRTSLLYSALFGLLIYGTYESTNYAIIDKWPLLFALIDVLWGTTLTIITTFIIKHIYT